MLVEVPTTSASAPLFIGRAPKLEGQRYEQADQQELVDHGIGLLVCLLEDDECDRYGEPLEARREATLALGIRWAWLPIEDFGVPNISEHLRAATIIRQVRADGFPVFVHCMAGLGRAGTLAAAILVEEGLSSADAIGLVRWVRPGAIQSDEQEAFIRTTYTVYRD
jgi:ADP-ribosyl-[dinitrogen reductase] hydrolase